MERGRLSFWRSICEEGSEIETRSEVRGDAEERFARKGALAQRNHDVPSSELQVFAPLCESFVPTQRVLTLFLMPDSLHGQVAGQYTPSYKMGP